MVSRIGCIFENLHFTRFVCAFTNVTKPAGVATCDICHFQSMDMSRMFLWFNTVKTQVKVATFAVVVKCFSDVLTFP